MNARLSRQAPPVYRELQQRRDHRFTRCHAFPERPRAFSESVRPARRGCLQDREGNKADRCSRTALTRRRDARRSTKAGNDDQAVLNKALKSAKRKGMVRDNVAADADNKPRVPRQGDTLEKAWTPQEARKFLTHVKQHGTAMESRSSPLRCIRRGCASRETTYGYAPCRCQTKLHGDVHLIRQAQTPLRQRHRR